MTDTADFTDKLGQPSAIVGVTGSGKTFAAKRAVEILLELGRRVIVIDPTGAWYGLRSAADGSATGGYPVLIFGGDHADIPIGAEAGARLGEALATREVQAIIDTSEMTGGQKIRFMTDFFTTLYARNKAALHLVVDEADEICPQNPMPEERRLSGAFDKIVRRGRIKGFRPLMLTQRPAVLHKNVLSQIATLIALKLTSPQDRKAIEGWVAGHADTEQAREVIGSLASLKRGEGWIWSPAAGVLDRVKFPPIKSFDSSRTPEDGETLVAPALAGVDVEALREDLMPVAEVEIFKPGTVGAIGQAAQIEKVEAARKVGYERGFAAGREEGYREGRDHGGRLMAHRQIIRVVESLVGAAMLNGDSDAIEAARVRMEAIDLGVPDRHGRRGEGDAGSPSGKAPPFDGGTAGSIPAPATNGQAAALGAERKPLAVLAAAHPAGLTEAQWASLAGFKRSGGTWGTYKSRLRTAGMIFHDQHRGLWFASDEGMDALGGAVVALPRDPDERIQLWSSKLSGVGPMLSALRQAWPDALPKETLAARTGYAASGGTFGTYLSRLRSNGLVVADKRGIRLAPAIMGDGNA